MDSCESVADGLGAKSGDWTADLYVMKAELERLRHSKQEERRAMSAENDVMQRRLDDARAQIKSLSDALSQSSIRHNVATDTMKQEKHAFQHRLDGQLKVNQDLQNKVNSLTNELRGALIYMEKLKAANYEREKESKQIRTAASHEGERWKEITDAQTHDLEAYKESIARLEEKIMAHRDELSRKTTELRLTKIALEDRENQSNRLQKDLHQKSTQLDYYTEQFRSKKEENIRLQVKIDALHDRIEDLQALLKSTQRRVIEEQERSRNLEANIIQLHSNIEEYSRIKSNLEDRIKDQNETIEGLNDDIRFAHNRRELTLEELRSAQDALLARQDEVTSLKFALNSANGSKTRFENEVMEMKRLTEEQSKMLDDARIRNLDQLEQLEQQHQQQKKQKQHQKQQQKQSEHQQQRRSRASIRIGDAPSQSRICDDVIDGDDARQQRHLVGSANDEKYLTEDGVYWFQKGSVFLSPDQTRKTNSNSNRNQSRDSDAPRHGDWSLPLAEAKEIVSKLGEAQQKSETLTRDAMSLRDQLTKARRKIKELEHTAFEATKRLEDKLSTSNDAAIKQLQTHCDHLHRKLIEEQEARTQAEKDLSRYKANVNKVYVQKSEMDAIVAKVKAFSQAEVSARMDEVNGYLKEQVLAREALDKLRSSNEIEFRKCHEREIEDLQGELSRMRQSNLELISEKSVLELEVRRLQKRIEEDLGDAQKMTPRMMAKITEKFKLDPASIRGSISCGVQGVGSERPVAGDGLMSRRSAMESPGRHRDTGADLGRDSEQLLSRTRSSDYDALSRRVLGELDRSIAKHMEKSDAYQYALEDRA